MEFLYSHFPAQRNSKYGIEGFHDSVRTPCTLRGDAMLDIFLRGAV